MHRPASLPSGAGRRTFVAERLEFRPLRQILRTAFITEAAPLLVPIRLHLGHVEHALTAGSRAVVEAHVRQHIRLVPMAAAEVLTRR